MGRLRDRRRGGGPARTLTGLNRTGTATKIMGNKGGINNPIVGEATNGEIHEVVIPDDKPVTTDVGARRTAALLMEVDWTSGGAISETNPPDGQFGYTLRGEKNLVCWANQAVTLKFWVF